MNAATLEDFAVSNQNLLDSVKQAFSSPGPRGAQGVFCSDCCTSNGNDCGPQEN